MSKRAVWGLFAVVVALIVYIFIFERTSITSTELIQRKARAFPTFVRDRVTALDIKTSKGAFSLTRDDLEQGDFAPWNMDGGEDQADPEAVDEVLGELEWLSARRTLTDVTEKDLERFGLDKPRVELTYKVGDAKHVVALGASDVHDENVYARLDKEPTVLVVPKTVVEALDHDRDHFRSKQFLDSVTLAWVPKAKVVHGVTEHAVAKEGQRWWYTTGMKGHASKGQVERLLNSVEQLRATRFVPDAPAITEPAIRVVVHEVPPAEREDKKPRKVELLIGGPCPGHDGERLASASGSAERVCISAEDVKVFEQGKYLRDHNILSVDPSEVEEIHLDVGGADLSVKRDGEEWKPVGDSDLPLDRDAVEAWLNDVQALQATAFEPLPTGFAPVEMLRFGLVEEGSTTVALGPPDARELVRVRRDDEPVLLVVKAADAQRLRAIPQRFATLFIWPDTQPSAVRKIEAQKGEHARTLVLEGDTWNAAKGPKVENPARIRRVLRDVLKTRAISRISDQALPLYKLDSPSARLVLTLEDGSTSRLEVGASSSLIGHYARSETGSILEVDASVFGGLLGELAGAPPKASNDDEDHDEEEDPELAGDHDHDHE